jgi:hypothetical protein
MMWFWLNIPLAVLFFGAWCGIPLAMVLRKPDWGAQKVGGAEPVPAVAVHAGEPQVREREPVLAGAQH